MSALDNLNTNADKLIFSSTWEIDQLVASGTVSLTPPQTTVYTITDSPSLPTFYIQFKPTGSSKWYNLGENSSNQTLASTFNAISLISSGSIIARADVSGTIRYYIWKDRLDN